jgi:hypothetical protein
VENTMLALPDVVTSKNNRRLLIFEEISPVYREPMATPLPLLH